MYQLLRKRLGGKKGFTLIELIVVIAIIAILAVILIPRFTGFTKSAREKSVMSDARNVLMAIEALDSEGKLKVTIGSGSDTVNAVYTGVGDATVDVYQGVNTYLGKNLLVDKDADDLGNEECAIVSTVTRSSTGFTFRLNKVVSGTLYYAQVTDSEIVVGEGEAPPTP